MSQGSTVTYADVAAAAERLRGVAHRTPVMTSRTLDARTGVQAYLKCENLQRMGAFKFRGAYNCIAQLDAAARLQGVVAYSSGNHAQGVALAARLAGVPAAIVMPHDAPAAKVAATREYGAEVIGYDRRTMNRGEIAERIARERGATLVPPYDDAAIIAGQGTTARELLEDVPELDALLVPVGGGGLLAGCALAATHVRPGIALYGVEPAAGDDFAQSFVRGERLEIPVPDTIADGQQTTSPGRLTFPIVKRLCRGFFTVSDDAIRAAMRFAFERLKLVVEPSGASALAALLQDAPQLRGSRVGVILSGGNVDAALYADIVHA
ncbi:MAG: threo-3-hydroxy-L-aspartate ammonia-lyase [Candidatus Eremiobacteraeota bacterium]|nr:threo-3-hydroxy-L-aspartate ammonia-lyase [Candidatus Eremiobacteraeota bacterium]MBC5803161.1 threo-3-hydroxy-L-aspartate ammonia-lyase [Candidatus Eremiobacteraeota bacterium]MBC5822964.1 threo-3-hydroxy-L-aspartate ammonia-lyase [Candidatus Eremiobacteraeota bacterium]